MFEGGFGDKFIEMCERNNTFNSIFISTKVEAKKFLLWCLVFGIKKENG